MRERGAVKFYENICTDVLVKYISKETDREENVNVISFNCLILSISIIFFGGMGGRGLFC